MVRDLWTSRYHFIIVPSFITKTVSGFLVTHINSAFLWHMWSLKEDLFRTFGTVSLELHKWLSVGLLTALGFTSHHVCNKGLIWTSYPTLREKFIKLCNFQRQLKNHNNALSAPSNKSPSHHEATFCHKNLQDWLTLWETIRESYMAICLHKSWHVQFETGQYTLDSNCLTHQDTCCYISRWNEWKFALKTWIQTREVS